MSYTKDDVPDASDPEFFTKFTLPDDVEDEAFGVGAPLPRVTRRPPRPAADSAPDENEGER